MLKGPLRGVCVCVVAETSSSGVDSPFVDSHGTCEDLVFLPI